MYSSLHKIDIVANGPDGRKLLVQTDHRDPAEVEPEAELSVLFALTRLIMAQRSEPGGVVRYAAIGGAHPRLVEVVASAGAELEAGTTTVDLSATPRRPLADLADEAFAGLAAKVLAREGATADESGLAVVERSLAGAPSRDDDEIGYWTAVAELAAVTGEVLRAKASGRWVDDPKDYADIPFMFQPAGDTGLVNAAGKAVKFLQFGDAESPRQLLRALEDRGTPDGPLLPSLKPSTWGARDQTVTEPFVASLDKAGADVPIVVYGHDHPNTFAMMLKDAEATLDLAKLRREALANLASVEVQVQTVDLKSLSFLAVSGSYFAAEKILDEAFMLGLHRRLGAQLLAAAVPEKGHLFVVDATSGPEVITAFMALAQGVFQKNEGGRQLSPTVFLVSEGNVVGVASVGEPVKKKGFFSRWFN